MKTLHKINTSFEKSIMFPLLEHQLPKEKLVKLLMVNGQLDYWKPI